MEIADLLKFYAPLLGMLGMSFWLGLLSDRVTTLEREIRDAKEGAAEMGTLRERLGRFEERLDTLTTNGAALARGMEGVQRQLGNLMQRGVNGVIELHTHGD